MLIKRKKAGFAIPLMLTIAFVLLAGVFFLFFIYQLTFTGKLIAFSGGSGTLNDPYIITTCSELQNISANLSAHYKLGNNIDCSGFDFGDGKGFMPLGNSSSFSGTFNGSNYNITNLYINRSISFVGLFGHTSSTANISNVGLLDVNVTGTNYVGGLVGFNTGTISNSYSTGTVTGDGIVGGLVGFNTGTISNSYSTGTVTGNSNVGGLAGGSNYGTISNSYSTGTVTGINYIGGLVGSNYGTISNSYSTGNVSGTDSVGGLVGSLIYGTISNSYSTGTVTGAESVGGLVGYNEGGTISNSSSIANVTGINYIGGLVGSLIYGTISNSSSIANVTGDSYVGGLVGYNEGGTISNSSSIANVTGDSYVGGLVGYNEGGTISNSSSIANVTGDSYVGGLVGYNEGGTISNSYSTGNVSGTDSVGGLVGSLIYGTISNSYSTGTVTGNSDVGGLVGYNEGGTISNSYAVTNRGFVCNQYEWVWNGVITLPCSLVKYGPNELLNFSNRLTFLNSNFSFSGFNVHGMLISNSFLNISNTSKTFISSMNNSVLYMSYPERTDFVFLRNVNATNLNITEDISATNSSLYVNITKHPGLNVPANITFDLRGYYVNDGRILRNNIECTSSSTPSCVNFTPLTGGLIMFNVSGWSEYKIGGYISSTCGNGIIDSGELCDGNNFNNKTCSDFGNFNSGNLICSSTCTQIITSNCSLTGGGSPSSGGGGGGGGTGGGGGGSSSITRRINTSNITLNNVSGINVTQENRTNQTINQTLITAPESKENLKVLIALLLVLLLLLIITILFIILIKNKKNKLPVFSTKKFSSSKFSSKSETKKEKQNDEDDLIIEDAKDNPLKKTNELLDECTKAYLEKKIQKARELYMKAKMIYEENKLNDEKTRKRFLSLYSVLK